MAVKEEIKEKTKKIYAVLPRLDDRRCGYQTCGQFARAVADGKAPCNGCVSGGPEVAAKVCEIMGIKVPGQEIPQVGPAAPEIYRSLFSRGRSMGTNTGRGFGKGRGLGRGGGRGRGVGKGRRGR